MINQQVKNSRVLNITADVENVATWLKSGCSKQNSDEKTLFSDVVMNCPRCNAKLRNFTYKYLWNTTPNKTISFVCSVCDAKITLLKWKQ